MTLPEWLRSGVEVRVLGIPLVLALPFLVQEVLEVLTASGGYPPAAVMLLPNMLYLLAVPMALLFLADLLDAAGLLWWRPSIAGRVGVAIGIYLLMGFLLALWWGSGGPQGVLSDPFEALVWPQMIAWQVFCPSNHWACLQY